MSSARMLGEQCWTEPYLSFYCVRPREEQLARLSQCGLYHRYALYNEG